MHKVKTHQQHINWFFLHFFFTLTCQIWFAFIGQCLQKSNHYPLLLFTSDAISAYKQPVFMTVSFRMLIERLRRSLVVTVRYYHPKKKKGDLVWMKQCCPALRTHSLRHKQQNSKVNNQHTQQQTTKGIQLTTNAGTHLHLLIQREHTHTYSMVLRDSVKIL